MDHKGVRLQFQILRNPGGLADRLRHLQANIYGNREFLGLLRNTGKFFCSEESRELDLQLIDYDDDPSNN